MKAKCCLLVGGYGINLVELMDEWESNTNRRRCWGSAGRYWVARDMQERYVSVERSVSCREERGLLLERKVLFRLGRWSFCLGFFLGELRRENQEKLLFGDFE